MSDDAEPDDPVEIVTTEDVRAAVKFLQAALLAVGYYDGPVTGIWDGECQSAIQVFQAVRS